MGNYNKLVRDKIAEIIRANGENPVVRNLSDDEFIHELRMKLKEEVQEFLVDESMEELAVFWKLFMDFCLRKTKHLKN